MKPVQDSIDISQIKVLAFDLENAAVGASTGEPPHKKQHIGKSCEDELFRATRSTRPTESIQPTNTTNPRSASSNPSSELGLEHTGRKRQRLSASQPELPSTIPESIKTKMSSLGSGRDGDTQPLSQWVLDTLERQSKVDSKVLETHSQMPFTYTPGQKGHVNLVGFLDTPRVDVEDEMEQQDEDIVGLSQVDAHVELFPESRRFQIPKTPCTNGRKPTCDGSMIDGVFATPRLPVNPFANHVQNDVGVMDLSQVFKATQAPSSPFTNVLPSEGLSDRPSPDMFNIQRPSTAQPFFSPTRVERTGMHRSVTEPHAHYVSMKQSQAERERQLQLQSTSSPVDMRSRVNYDSDDEFNLEDDVIQRRMAQKKIDTATRAHFNEVKASSRPNQSARGRGKNISFSKRDTRPPSPLSTKRARNTVLISDDQPGHESADNETEHEEILNTPEAQLPDELGESNKENVSGRSVQVPMTAVRDPRRLSSSKAPQFSPIPRHRLQCYDEIDELAEALKPDPGRADAAKHIGEGMSAVAVVDSQSSQGRKTLKEKRMSPADERVPPSPSPDIQLFVPHSQINQLPNTSQIDSSMARRILNGSPQLASSPVLPTVTRSPKARTISLPRQQESFKEAVFQEISSHNGRLRSLLELNSSPPKLPNLLPTTGVHRSSSGNPVAELDLIKNREEPALCLATTLSYTPVHNSVNLRSTVPETSSLTRNPAITEDVAPCPRVKDLSSTCVSKVSTSLSIQEQSNRSTKFETAQTHLRDTPSRFRVQQLNEGLRLDASPSKSRVSSTRSFADIIADSSLPDEVGEVDLDVGLMTAEDIELQTLVEGSSPIAPARKRRRGQGGRVLPTLVSAPEQPFAVPTSSPYEIIHQSCFNAVAKPSDDNLAQGAHQGENSGDHLGHKSKIRKQERLTAKNNSDHVNNGTVSESSTGEKIPREPFLSKQSTTSCLKSFAGVRNSCMKSKLYPAVTNSAGGKISGETHDDDFVAPNRVFAKFNGSPAGFYPATCIGVTGGNEPRYRVRFDDGTLSTVTGFMIKRLELRAGDTIKVDQKGARNNTYVVLSLKNRQLPSDQVVQASPSKAQYPKMGIATKYPETDLYGYRSVSVVLKQLASANEPQPNSKGETIHLNNIYLTSTIWASFNDRAYTYYSPQRLTVAGLQTPSERPSTPSTLSSQGRRVRQSIKPHSRGSVTASIPHNGSKLFDNMVFSVTNVDDGNRQVTIDLICSNGGLLLKSGFHELFDMPALGPMSPSKRTSTNQATSLQLKATAFYRGFTCLIANEHCRNQKFFQALALDIPCIATRWIRDCHHRQTLLPWQPYLLSSGVSRFLGTVKSRVLPSYSSESARLSDIIQSRPKFLSGSSVLLVMGKGKEEQMMKAYPFIAYALGATKVSRAVSLEAAKQMLVSDAANGEEWDWICFTDAEKQTGPISASQEKALVRHAENVFFGKESGSKKLKRGSTSVTRTSHTKVVVTEYVIQSLILGNLLEDE